MQILFPEWYFQVVMTLVLFIHFTFFYPYYCLNFLFINSFYYYCLFLSVFLLFNIYISANTHFISLYFSYFIMFYMSIFFSISLFWFYKRTDYPSVLVTPTVDIKLNQIFKQIILWNERNNSTWAWIRKVQIWFCPCLNFSSQIK